MKIAVAVEKPEKNSLLSNSFGRSDFFLIFDPGDGSGEFFSNPFVKELGGAGIQTAKFLIEKNIKIVISSHIGKNPFRFLTSSGIKVYGCDKVGADTALQLFNEGKLNLFECGGEDICFGRRRKRRIYKYL